METTTTTTGGALRRARELAGLSTGGAARRMGVPSSTVRAWETGRATPTATQVEAAARLYGNDLAQMWPDRTPLAHPSRPGVLVVGEETVDLGSDELGRRPDNHTVLVQYLAAVRRQRGMAPRERIELRGNDIVSLARVLDLDDADLDAELQQLLDLTPTGSRMTVRAMVVASLMAVAATGVVTGSWVAPTATAASGEQAAQTTATHTAGIEGPPTQPVGAVTGYLTTDPAEISSTVEARTSPFSTTPNEAADVELGPPVFAVAPATEWSYVNDVPFSTDPAEGAPGVIVEMLDEALPGPIGQLGLPVTPSD